VEKVSTNKFISTIDDVSNYSIQVKAAVNFGCRENGLWSEWSQPIYVGESVTGRAGDPGKYTCFTHGP
jgi:hypothetical protein